ncbi:MAG: nucleoside hydrolase [Planctomycetota bacterium]
MVVGGNAASQGRWPPLWPYEFNLRCDRRAAVRVFASHVPITVVPLDVGRRLLLPRALLEALSGRFGDHARMHTGRWFARARRLFRRDAIRLYDLLAVAAVLLPAAVHCVNGRVHMHRRGWLEFGASGRPVRIVCAFDDAVLGLLTIPGALPARAAPKQSTCA